MTADQTAAVIQVLTLEYDGDNLLDTSFTPHVNDTNGNGYIDIYDLKNAHLTGLPGLDAGVSKNFDISVRLKSDIGNDFQGDGITVTMTFTLKQ